MENMAGLPELREQANQQICEMVKTKVNELTSIWSDVGISYEPTRSRLERTRAHIANLLDQMLEGEVEMRERLLRNITEFSDELQKLSLELSVPNPAIDDSLTMLEKENVIRERLEQLKQIKGFRKRERKKLRSKECELCTKLGMPALALSNASTPTENDLQELEQHVAQLEREKAIRSCTLSALRNSIVAKLNLLDLQPESELEIQLVEDQDGFILSNSNIDEARAYLERLTKLEEARRQELAALQDQLALFFDRLDIPPEEQDRIRDTSSGLTPATMAALKDKLAEYERKKRERLREFVVRVKDELLTWYKKCCLPKSRVYLDDDCEDVTEQHLAKLEEQLKSLKDFYSENKVIIAKAERHEALWLRSLELEKLAMDPSRLMNRGGRLLLETKERQRLQTELPRLRQEIKDYITTYSGRSEIFALWGKDFLSHLDSQQRAHAEEKERERLERESRRKATPSKSSSMKRTFCATPSSSASKMSRLGISSATIGSSRRGGTPASKNNLVAHGGTPVRAGAAAISAAKSIRRRSLKAQKKSANGRQLFKGKGAEEASTSTAGPVGGLTSMDSFAHFLAQRNGKQLTSSILEAPRPSQPEAAPQAAGPDLDLTLTEEQVRPL
ncbi:protein regulator of cytokinesis 1-like isoform X1 [Dermacentor silvarum]|uniref:protein regulator of cytokinesis 1-like isoform X1 n=1 Tax=Dermacentor silvarum TaxID=543639 RepID=UPI00189A6A57|nr:protein regulator of cytokinesis 1-like isoform X1 [Dermacentor silvarum]